MDPGEWQEWWAATGGWTTGAWVPHSPTTVVATASIRGKGKAASVAWRPKQPVMALSDSKTAEAPPPPLNTPEHVQKTAVAGPAPPEGAAAATGTSDDTTVRPPGDTETLDALDGAPLSPADVDICADLTPGSPTVAKGTADQAEHGKRRVKQKARKRLEKLQAGPPAPQKRTRSPSVIMPPPRRTRRGRASAALETASSSEQPPSFAPVGAFEHLSKLTLENEALRNAKVQLTDETAQLRQQVQQLESRCRSLDEAAATCAYAVLAISAKASAVAQTTTNLQQRLAKLTEASAAMSGINSTIGATLGSMRDRLQADDLLIRVQQTLRPDEVQLF